ncbi:MAG: hypothetical protein RLY20_2418 [Verrucomicrobiota bacterium]|jgi:hypothetical protein
MKNSKQNSILMGISAVCVVASLILCGFVLQYNHVLRAAQITQAQGMELQNVKISRQMMFGEIAEYAKRNPDIQRILPGIVPPAAKPSTK